MADTLYAIDSGFYDSDNKDRLYDADDMGKPYASLVSDGIYGTGSESTALKVTADNSGMTVSVAPGNAILGKKWVELASALSVEVPENSGESTRIDSVILRVNTNDSARIANIIYRTGGDSEPAIINTGGVFEARLANVSVASGAATIASGAVTDKRGTADCPWARLQADLSGIYSAGSGIDITGNVISLDLPNLDEQEF